MNVAVNAFSTTLKPVELIEDSRCPSSVQCIQAGTVRVRTEISTAVGNGEAVLKLNEKYTTEAEEITLIDVRPAKIEPGATPTGDYVFVFEVRKR
jgi:hypothetical protein